ncbi:MAG: hypothetical protein QOG83_550 [Alphaproteobacteria bacterium]|nr:hypothetical protein [Alphaproteobacteria bacterium]
MHNRVLIGLVALGLSLLSPAAQAADDLSKFPDLKGQWIRVGQNRWETATNKAPLTPEYRAVYEANQVEMAAGAPGDMPSWYCLPQGMPMMMSLYDPMEIVVTPAITYVMISHVNDSLRRIYTDGRGWPAEGEYELTFAGYSLGTWIDSDGDGRYDLLEVESRHFKGPRVYDGSGLPLHRDNQSIVKERIYLDKADQNILVNEITVIDNALTKPWSVTKKARRDTKAKTFWQTAVCAENNSMVRIGKEPYYMSQDGYLMPVKKDQQPPDLKYFKRSGN